MTPGSDTYVIFRVDEEEYALPVSQVNAIIRFEEATTVPRSHESVLGVINLRGRVIPVVDVRRRFRGERFEPSPAARIVITEGSGGPVGLAVDAAKEVSVFSRDEIRPVPDGVVAADMARAFTGVVQRGGSLVILLDLDEAVGHWPEVAQPVDQKEA